MNKYFKKALWRLAEVIGEHEIKRHYRSLKNQKPLEEELDGTWELIRKAEAKRAATSAEPVVQEDNPTGDNDALNSFVTPKSFQEMMKNPLSSESSWIIPGLAAKGQFSAIVAGSDGGKTILSTDCGIAVHDGEVPAFVTPGFQPCAPEDVVYYRLEPRPGEMEKRGYTDKLFSDKFKWIELDDLPSPNLDGLLKHLINHAAHATKDTVYIVDPLSKLDDWDAETFYNKVRHEFNKIAEEGIIHSVIATIHADEKEPWKVATSVDIRGGDRLIQLWDSVVMLHRERREGYRFLQHLKYPKGEVEKPTVSVIKFWNDPYTHFIYDSEKALSEALPLKPKATEVQETKPSDAYEMTQDDAQEIIRLSKEPGPKSANRPRGITAAIDEFRVQKAIQRASGTLRNDFYKCCDKYQINPQSGEQKSE